MSFKKKEEVTGELIIDNKGKRENAKRFVFHNYKKPPKIKGNYLEIDPKKASSWEKKMVLKCHETLNQKCTILNNKPGSVYSFWFSLDDVEYKLEVTVWAINELTKGNLLIKKYLESETKLFKFTKES